MTMESRKKKKQQENLEEQSVNNQILRDQITKQVKLSVALQKGYEGRILDLQNTALGMCRYIQLQRKKNDDLKSIITHMESKNIVPRRQQSQSLYLPEPPEPLENLESIIKKQHKLQYDFDQLVQKHNQSLSQINDIHDKVNASRAERVIYSGVFRNIERQIILMQQEYKKLIIERVYVEKQKTKAQQLYVKKLAEAQKRVRGQGEMPNISRKEEDKEEIKPKEEIKQTLKLQKVKSHKSGKRKDDSLVDTRNSTHLDESREQSSSVLSHKLQSVHIDHIKSQTGLSKNLQQIGYYFENIEQINSGLYNQSERLNSQIEVIEGKLKNAKKSKNIHQVQRMGLLGETQKARLQKQQRIKNANDNLQEKIILERNNLKNLWDQAKLGKLLDMLKIKVTPDYSICEQNIVLFYQQVQEKLNLIPSIEGRPVATTTCDPDSKEKSNSLTNYSALSEIIQSADKQRQCQKLLLHNEFTQVCEKELGRSPERPNIVKPINRKVKK